MTSLVFLWLIIAQRIMQELPIVNVETETRIKKPDWLRVKLPVGKKYTDLRGIVDKYKLNTILISPFKI